MACLAPTILNKSSKPYDVALGVQMLDFRLEIYIQIKVLWTYFEVRSVGEKINVHLTQRFILYAMRKFSAFHKKI